MINVSNLNKYYHKGKSNEIHVINNTNLVLPNSGFVVFLGASGSGKTTLINVIAGLDKAKGEYVIFLNAGDAFATPETLARIALKAQNHPNVIYGQTQLVDSSGKIVGMRHLTAPAVLDWKSFKDGMLVCHQAFIAKRELCPYYDLKYRFSADYDWCIKVLKKSNTCAYVGDEPIISYLSEGLTTENHKKSLRERYHIMCHYYGTVSTILHHVKFAIRHLMRKF